MRAYFKRKAPTIYPIVSSAFKWLSRLVYGLITKHPKKWVVIKAVTTGLPAAVLSFATLRLAEKAPGQDWLSKWLTEHIWAVFFILAWPLFIQALFALIEWLMDSTRDQIIQERMRFATLYTALEEVVGRKGKRFGEFADQIRRGAVAPSRGEAFDAVTDPGRQIEFLVEAAFSVVNQLLCKPNDLKDVIKVVLVDIENGAPVRFRVHLPNNTVPQHSMLEPDKVRKTLWARAAQERKNFVVEDIAHHISAKGPRDKKYLASADTSADIGSIAAIPIIHPQSGHVPFVLSFKSSEPLKITDDFLKEIGPVLTAFKNRLLLEYNIEFIKERTNVRTQKRPRS